jgi:hypothetical protein
LVRDPLSENSSGATLKNWKKSISIHINIYMEKSLKQREQLEGYLRDKLLWWYENSKYDYPKEKKKDE